MKTNKVLVVGIFLAGILAMLQAPPTVMAQEPPPQDQGQPAQDPPGRVARLDYQVGSVSFQPGGEGDWVQAVANRPLTTGDNLWADKDSRAELQIGSTSIRLDSETSATFLELDDHTTQVRLSMGSIIFRVRHLDDEDHFEIDTPNSAFVVQSTGEYRVDVNADGNETDVTVWHGRGEITGGGASYDVVADQRATFTGTDQLDHEIGQIPAPDDFDNFAFNRDRREDRAESSNYISPEMTGYEDLDDYGSWHYVADYGPVWTPIAVAVGWAPYRFGHWVWVEPWGWTWVEDEPWGFAPFHYGRWAFVEGGWCWAPGPVVVRPVYAPAFVAFVGGGGFSFGFGIGAGVAWFPLAPREVFVPWYHTSMAYVNNVNITNTRVNITNITNVYNNYHSTTTNVTRINYANQHVPSAVTAVSRDTFVNARPVARNLAKVDPREIENAPVAREMPAQPSKASVLGAGGPAKARPPAAVANRQVVATRTPTLPRAPFEQRQAAANVRTETPGRAQPAGRPEEQPARGNETARPEQPRENQPVRSQEPARTEEPARPQEPSRAQEPARPEERAVPHPPSAGAGHPFVRQAPPVQENPQRQQSEQSKFNAWQQQRQNAPHPAPHAPAPHPGKR